MTQSEALLHASNRAAHRIAQLALQDRRRGKSFHLNVWSEKDKGWVRKPSALDRAFDEYEEVERRTKGGHGLSEESSAREVLTAEEAAEFLGFNPVTVRLKARSGEIPGRKVGKEWRFTRRVLLEWLENTEAKLETEAAKL